MTPSLYDAYILGYKCIT